MTKGEVSWKEMRTYNNLILDSRTGINSAFIPDTQWDAPEFYQSLLNKFCEENPNFKFIKPHLFCFIDRLTQAVLMVIIKSPYEMKIFFIFLLRTVSRLQIILYILE